RRIVHNSLRMSKTEAIDGLIHIADYCTRTSAYQEINQFLLCSVQVLVLVNEHMLEPVQLDTCGIIAKITESLGYEFADQHGFVKPKPIYQRSMKLIIGWIERPSRYIRLKPRPRRFKRAYSLCTLALASKRSTTLNV